MLSWELSALPGLWPQAGPLPECGWPRELLLRLFQPPLILGEGGVGQQQRSQGCFSMTSFNPSPLLTVPPGHVSTGQGWFAEPGLGLRSTPSQASARPV